MDNEQPTDVRTQLRAIVRYSLALVVALVFFEVVNAWRGGSVLIAIALAVCFVPAFAALAWLHARLRRQL